MVWSRNLDRARALAGRVGGRAVADPDEAVGGADVVSTATPSRRPLFSPGVLRPGTHINAVGAFTPEMVEIPGPVVSAARLFVDDLAAAAAEAGDVLQAGRTPDGTVADLLAGRMRGRTTAEQVTMFKSVGIASQDVAAAAAALDRADEAGIGVVLG
jgi:ornithine cyclodeaminase